MSTVTRPSGRLPARVYWVRRAVAVVVLALISSLAVLGFTALVGAGSSEDGSGQARQAAATPRPEKTAPSAESPEPSEAAQQDKPMTRKQRRAARREARREAARTGSLESIPQTPQGACEPRTVRISSRVADAFAATDITIPLDIITLGAEACSWEFSADTVALDITSGADTVWSSVQCPRALPREELVLVPGSSTPLTLEWNGQRSDADCSRAAGYAYPGWYHVLVAARGGEPYDQQFELTKAPDEVRTRTPKPRPRREDAAQPRSQTDAQTESGDEESSQGRTQSTGRDGD